MRNEMYGNSAELTQKNKRKRLWYKVVGAMASVVVFCTTYALILPAITMSEEYYCGFEEHTHSQECYEDNSIKTNICQAQPHQHTQECFDNAGNQICNLADFFIHQHSEICYDGIGKLVCQLPEHYLHQHTEDCYLGEALYSCGRSDTEPHSHIEECYTQETVCICEIQEQQPHQHTDECYGNVQQLVCTLEECEAHVHKETCKELVQILSCQVPESEAHHHDVSCYGEELVLICTEEESELHSHGETCYTAEHRILCGREETDGHVHTDACYSMQETVICGFEETQGHSHAESCYEEATECICDLVEDDGHVHADSCFELQDVLCCELEDGELHQHDSNCILISEPVLVCTKLETVLGGHSAYCCGEEGITCSSLVVYEHSHTDECFHVEEVTEPVLICQLEEHTHELICTSDTTADVETAEIWRKTIPAADTMTGNYGEDLLAIAQSQLGYQESSRNFIVTDDGERKGYTRYGQWYGDKYGDWCAMYVSFCLYYANIPKEVFPYEAGCQRWIDDLNQLSLYMPVHEYVPVPGDVIFFGSGGRSTHVGIVYEVSDQEIKTIEGNAGNCVCYNTYSVSDDIEKIMGYGSIEAAYQRGIDLGLIEVVPVETTPETQGNDVDGKTEISDTTEPTEATDPIEPTESTGPAEVTVEIDAETQYAIEAQWNGISFTLLANKSDFDTEYSDLSLAVSSMNDELTDHIQNKLSSFKTSMCLDLQIYDGQERVHCQTPVQLYVNSMDDAFRNAEDFLVLQYSGVTDNGALLLTEVNSYWDEELGLCIETSQLSGLVITYEMPYDGIELETDFGDIHIRLRAPKDAFPVTAENLTLVVTEPDESLKASIAENMDEDQNYFAVDIRILCNGEPIQPNGDVQVIFEMNRDPFVDYESVEVFHVLEDDQNQIKGVRQVEGGRNSDGDVVMETDHFSTYVVAGSNEAPVVYAAGATPTNTWQEALTDRSGNIGVESEGYADSPYTKTRQFNGTNITALTSTGGTVYVGNGRGLNYGFYAERYWDGTKPVRITSTDPDDRATLTRTIYADIFLEDGKAPNAPIKFDNIHLETNFAGMNIYGRGNKIVIGENVTTESGENFRIYGGSDTNNSTTSCPTNVVVESGNWHLVCGGGHGDIPNGTTVTVRGDANITTLYGGGTERSTVGTPDGQNTDVNIHIEGGNIGALYGGNRVEKEGCAIYEDINIEVTGGHVGILCAGNDYSYVDNPEEWEESFVQGNVTVSIRNGGSATQVIGDPYHTAYNRSVKGSTILECYVDEKFNMLDQWDVVRIIGNGTPNSTTVETLDTTGGKYIGRIEVNNGGRLYMDMNGYINILNEKDQMLIPLNDGSTPYDLKHAWQGESTEERRNLSTLAIEGAAITPSGNYYFDQDEGKAGLRIKGNVEGYSTLEACGDPMYSTGDTYYYYVVADSSDNGGKAFREPEGAPYVVCYRYLEDGRIGWYLRERPVLTMTNSLVRVGTEGTLTPTENGFYTGCPSNYVIMHVDMKGFAYEWSSTPGKNRVDFSWSIFDGYENASKTTGGISLQTMADIENNIYSTSNPNGIFANVEYNAMGSDEGSTEQTKRVSSFYVIIDTSKAVNPRYYDVSSSFHYTRGEDNYDDLRVGQTVDAARCTYDFDKEGDINEGLPSDGYANSVMTTYEYKDGIPPKGADDALLRVYLPEGVSANTLTVKELDEQFTFEKTGITASLVSNSQVATYYSTEEESTYNHKFGVTLLQTGASETDLAGGATLNNLSGKETYHCAVYSHAKISFTDITPESNLGLQLQLQLNSLTKGGNAVGNGNPYTVNDGELRIQVYPVGTIFDTTTVTVKKIVTGDKPSTTSEFEFLLSYPKLNENGQNVTHEEKFTLRHDEEKTFIVPLETEITIKEINHDGYHVQTKMNDSEEMVYSDTVSITTPDKEHLTGEELEVIFYNSIGTELPGTGGFGTQIYTFLGLLLTLSALALFWMHRRERRAVR